MKHWLMLIDATNQEIGEFETRKVDAMAKLIFEKVVVPYCKATGMRFSAGMGGYTFIDTKGRCFDIGEERYSKPDRPDGLEGDEDEYWVTPTEEEKQIREILDYPIGPHGSG